MEADMEKMLEKGDLTVAVATGENTVDLGNKC